MVLTVKTSLLVSWISTATHSHKMSQNFNLLSHLTEHSQVTVLAGFNVRQTLLHLMS